MRKFIFFILFLIISSGCVNNNQNNNLLLNSTIHKTSEKSQDGIIFKNLYYGRYIHNHTAYIKPLIDNNPIDKDYNLRLENMTFTNSEVIVLNGIFTKIWEEEMFNVLSKLECLLASNEISFLKDTQSDWEKYIKNDYKFFQKMIIDYDNDVYIRDDGGREGHISRVYMFMESYKNRTIDLLNYYYIFGGRDYVFLYDKNDYEKYTIIP